MARLERVVADLSGDKRLHANGHAFGRLPSNGGVAMLGASVHPACVVSAASARRMLAGNRPVAARLLRPMISGRDVARFPEGRWVFDLTDVSEREIDYLQGILPPEVLRDRAMAGRVPAIPNRITSLKNDASFLVTATVSKHRIIVRCQGHIVPTSSVVVFRDVKSWLLPLLSSQVHSHWSEFVGRRRGGISRYAISTFETFPLPRGFSLAGDDLNRIAPKLAEIGEELIRRRTAWQFAGFDWYSDGLDEALLRDLTARFENENWKEYAELRPLNLLYDDPPKWHEILMRDLNEAVFEAYGLPRYAGRDQVLDMLVDMSLEAGVGSERTAD